MAGDKPTQNDDVLLQFDITINGNAYCRPLHTNGHYVTVNTNGSLCIPATAVLITWR